MTKLSLTLPEIGSKNTVAEPRVGTALQEIREFLNTAKLESTDNLKPEGIKEVSLEKGLQEKIGAKSSGLTYKLVSESTEIKNGELFEVNKEGATITLPAPTASFYVGIFAGSGANNVKVKTNGGNIFGDFLEGVSVATLQKWQHLVLEADGSNWLILSGEPKRQQEYGFVVERANNVEYEASVNRPTFVVLTCIRETGTIQKLTVNVGGVNIGESINEAGTGPVRLSFSFICPASMKWKAEFETTNGGELKSHYLPM